MDADAENRGGAAGHAGRSVGVTGHQARDGIDWSWVRGRVRDALRDAAPVDAAFTCLAVGTDQVFAEEALARGVDVAAVLPFADYERCFKGQGLENYRSLLARCTSTTTLARTGSDEEAFLAAGIRVADSSDLLVAVWDGKPAAGLGGTADVVAHARSRGRDVLHVDPFARTVRRLPG